MKPSSHRIGRVKARTGKPASRKKDSVKTEDKLKIAELIIRLAIVAMDAFFHKR